MPTLKKEVLQLLKSSEILQLKLADGMKRRLSTVKTWLRDEDEMLVSRASVLVIREITGLPEKQVLETEPVAPVLALE